MLINTDENKMLIGTKEDGKPLTVFVIDDSIAMVRIISLTLEGLGLNVVGSSVDIDEAIKTLKSHKDPIDIVTLDIMMPKQNDLSGLPAVKAAHPESKVVMVSALSDKVQVLKAIQMGADYYIIKPFNRGSVFAALHKLFIAKPPETSVPKKP